MKNIFKKARWLKFSLIAITLVFISTTGYSANDYYHYDKQDANDKVTINVQASGSSSWFTALTYLPETTSASLRGRLLAATGTSIYLQDAVDSSSWTQVGTTTSSMDPSFIRVSPDGSKIALGQGYNKNLLVFARSLITSGTTPVPNVATDSNTKVFPLTVKYYDAKWIDNTYLLINGGAWNENTDTAYNVGMSTLDTSSTSNNLNTILYDSTAIAASSGIAIDGNKNIIFGNGYSYNTAVSLQGELKMLPASVWWDSANSRPITFTTPAGGYLISSSRKFADQVLSAAHLGFDEEGNLHVGGGKYATTPPANNENGYAVLINKQVISDTADTNITLYQIDESDATQYRKIVADVCQNDTATGVLSYKRSISVHWLDNLSCGTPPTATPGSSTDSWSFSTASKLTTYRIDTSRDGDNDGFNDVVDHSPWTNFASNTDTDNDGYGNYIDADLDNDGDVDDDDNDIFDIAYGNTNNLSADFDCDGDVDDDDNDIFDELYINNNTAPFYNNSY